MSKFDIPMMKTAYIWSELSTCIRRKNGAVISIDNRIVSVGYNGAVSGKSNVCEEKCSVCEGSGRVPLLQNETIVRFVSCDHCQGQGLITNQFVLHAEANALMFCLRSGINTVGATLYATTIPCKECSKLIVQAGIKKVIYDQTYRDMSGKDFLESCGVIVRQLTPELDSQNR